MSNISTEMREKIILSYITSWEGRALLAKAFVTPNQQRVAFYQSWLANPLTADKPSDPIDLSEHIELGHRILAACTPDERSVATIEMVVRVVASLEEVNKQALALIGQ